MKTAAEKIRALRLRLRDAQADLLAAEQAYPWSKAREDKAQRRADDLRCSIADIYYAEAERADP